MATLKTTAAGVTSASGSSRVNGYLYADYTTTMTEAELIISGTVYLNSSLTAGSYGLCSSSSTNVTATNGTATKNFSNKQIVHSKAGTVTSNVGTFTISVPRKNTEQNITFKLSSNIALKTYDNKTASTTVSGSTTISLPALPKPSFSNDPITYDTSFEAPYAGVTTASVYVDEMTAVGEAYIASALLTIGNQTDELTGTATEVLEDGTLSILLGAVGTFTPTITVTDSRGQTKTVTLGAITVKGYSAPQVIVNSLERTDGNGTANDEGECAVVTATFNWTSAITDLTAPTLAAKDLDDTTVSTTTTWYTDRALQNAISDWSAVTTMPVYAFVGNSNTPPAPFDTQDSYNITITPNDEQGAGTPVTATLGSAFYTMDFLAGGHGIAFGMPSSQEGFFCNMDAHFKDGANLMRALHDFMRPVGSTYPTVDPNFNPNVTWGGTWEKLPEGYILLSGSDNGSYVVGDDTGTASGYKEYGENTKLIADENIAHGHGFTQPTITSHFIDKVSYGSGSASRPYTGGSKSTTGWNTASGGAVHNLGTPSQRANFNIMQKSIAVYWWIRTA